MTMTKKSSLYGFRARSIIEAVVVNAFVNCICFILSVKYSKFPIPAYIIGSIIGTLIAYGMIIGVRGVRNEWKNQKEWDKSKQQDEENPVIVIVLLLLFSIAGFLMVYLDWKQDQLLPVSIKDKGENPYLFAIEMFFFVLLVFCPSQIITLVNKKTGWPFIIFTVINVSIFYYFKFSWHTLFISQMLIGFVLSGISMIVELAAIREEIYAYEEEIMTKNKKRKEIKQKRKNKLIDDFVAIQKNKAGE